MPLLIGPLAHPALRERLAPGGAPVAGPSGRLVGGGLAGIAPDAFPTLAPGSDPLPAWRGDWSDDLARYARIMGLAPIAIGGDELLGVEGTVPDAPPALPAWSEADWPADLARAVADEILGGPAAARPPEAVRRRLAQLAGWVASRERAAAETAALAHLGPAPAPGFEICAREEPYAEYFSVEALHLRQRRHAGGWSPELLRAVFVSGDATVVLPWDPGRDRVLLIDQFRPGPAARHDARPWLYEAPAGRVDAGETPAEAARREAAEECGLTLTRLIEAPHNYPSPGAVAEYLYLYVGICDLPDGTAGIGGLADEDEDIRSHVIARADLTRMALAGQIRNGPLLALALWLEVAAAGIRAGL